MSYGKLVELRCSKWGISSWPNCSLVWCELATTNGDCAAGLLSATYDIIELARNTQEIYTIYVTDSVKKHRNIFDLIRF